jgi:Cu-Zn family superoxide dismutase
VILLKRHTAGLAALAAVGLVMTGAAWAADMPPDATAELETPQGRSVGEVDFYQQTHGVLLKGHLKGMPEGPHALHVHQTGKCSPGFDAAGGHFNPTGMQHGFDNSAGPHLGDLPDIHVPGSGMLDFDAFLYGVNVDSGQNMLADTDGSAIVIHQGADDYKTDPAGDAGPRIACGVIKVN